ncbi:uncharacterized protein LOC143735469 isoform X2 [Siphateles boraxobius]|uniref:uncharacterized protein LOC143735469 isoform X2 n=1 Tax=Siphateles boraxobius TaxID=180520 RepID=UPI00406355D5
MDRLWSQSQHISTTSETRSIPAPFRWKRDNIDWSIVTCCRLQHIYVTDAVKSVSVMEGDSLTLNPDVTEVQKYLLIQWTFGSTRIAEFNRLTQTSSSYDSRFTDRLTLDQTGSLTTTNIRTTDSGLYKLTIVGEETKYKSFNVTVNESPLSTSSPERSSSSNRVSSSFVVNHSTFIQTENNNNTELHKPSSDLIHCCSFTEAVIRLALSALVGVATVAVLVYDIRSTRRKLIRTELFKHYHQTSVQSDHQYELCRTFSSGYVET